MKLVFVLLILISALILFFTFRQKQVPLHKLIPENNNVDIYFVNASWCKYCKKMMTIIQEYNATSTNKIKLIDGPSLMKSPQSNLEKNIKKIVRGFPLIVVTKKNDSNILKQKAGLMTLNKLQNFINN